MLSAIGLPVLGDVAHSADEAVDVALEIGYPVILKPLDASHGRGISPRLDDDEAIRAAWPAAQQYADVVVVERFLEGTDHRVLVVTAQWLPSRSVSLPG